MSFAGTSFDCEVFLGINFLSSLAILDLVISLKLKLGLFVLSVLVLMVLIL